MQHGNFSGRLSSGHHGTDLRDGHTKWHLLAAGLYPDHSLEAFLAQAREESSDVLLDDLQEGMTVFPRSCWEDYVLNPTEGMTFPEFRCATAFKTPREICLVRKTPFLAGYAWRREWLPPVVAAFWVTSCRDLGFHPAMLLP